MLCILFEFTPDLEKTRQIPSELTLSMVDLIACIISLRPLHCPLHGFKHPASTRLCATCSVFPLKIEKHRPASHGVAVHRLFDSDPYHAPVSCVIYKIEGLPKENPSTVLALELYSHSFMRITVPNLVDDYKT